MGVGVAHEHDGAECGLDAVQAVAATRRAPTVSCCRRSGINFIATNVPGVQVPQYLLGHKCLDQIPLVPCGATLGYSVAILSYNSERCVSG